MDNCLTRMYNNIPYPTYPADTQTYVDELKEKWNEIYLKNSDVPSTYLQYNDFVDYRNWRVPSLTSFFFFNCK